LKFCGGNITLSFRLSHFLSKSLVSQKRKIRTKGKYARKGNIWVSQSLYICNVRFKQLNKYWKKWLFWKIWHWRLIWILSLYLAFRVEKWARVYPKWRESLTFQASYECKFDFKWIMSLCILIGYGYVQCKVKCLTNYGWNIN
jgi:hypothetical protein